MPPEVLKVTERPRPSPRKYYPHGLFEEISSLRVGSIDLRGEARNEWVQKWRVANDKANEFLRGLAREKSVPPASTLHVLDVPLLGGYAYEADVEFTEEEYGPIKKAMEYCISLREKGATLSSAEGQFLFESEGALIKKSPWSSDINLKNRENAVWKIFVAARAAETVILASEQDNPPWTLSPESKELMEYVRDLPDMLQVHPVQTGEEKE